ncbi:ribonuclease H-like domain-containing protein [Tanacetum coccineum]
MNGGSPIDRTVNLSQSNMLNKSVFLTSNTIIGQDGKVYSYCGLRLADIPASGADQMAKTIIEWVPFFRQKEFPQVAALIINVFGDGLPTRDIVVNKNNTGPQRISELHPSYMTLQYPLLFLYGEDGYHEKIPYHSNGGSRKTKRGYQYLVDAFMAIEEQRLNRTRNNQDTLRVALYHNLCDAMTRGDTSAAGLGKRIVFPWTFAGSPRYMIPCGTEATHAPCTTEGKCSKHFPKTFLAETVINEDEDPIYRCRDNKITAVKGPSRATTANQENVTAGANGASEQVIKRNKKLPKLPVPGSMRGDQNAVTLRESENLPTLLEREGINLTMFT